MSKKIMPKGLIRKIKPGESIDLLCGGRVVNIGKFNCTLKVVTKESIAKAELENQKGERDAKTS